MSGGGILRPRQYIARVTANAGNRGFIKGGKPRPRVTPTLPLALLFLLLIAPITVVRGGGTALTLREHFQGEGTFSLRGDWPSWADIDPRTGVLTLTPPRRLRPGVIAGLRIVLANDEGDEAVSNDFELVIT